MAEKKPKSLLDNAQFMAYVRGLPTTERRIIEVCSDGAEPKYVVATREGDGPVTISRDSTETNKQQGEPRQ